MLICLSVCTNLLEHPSSSSVSFYSISFSPSVYLLLSQPLHPPIYYSSAPISACCQAPMSPIRKGNEARYWCKYLGPLAAPWLITQRQKQGEREWQGEEETGKGWKGTAIRQKTDICTQNMLLNGTQWKKCKKTVPLCEVYYNAESFLQQSWTVKTQTRRFSALLLYLTLNLSFFVE